MWEAAFHLHRTTGKIMVFVYFSHCMFKQEKGKLKTLCRIHATVQLHLLMEKIRFLWLKVLTVSSSSTCAIRTCLELFSLFFGQDLCCAFTCSCQLVSWIDVRNNPFGVRIENQWNVGRPEFKLEDLIFLCILLQKMCFFHFSSTCNDTKMYQSVHELITPFALTAKCSPS